MRLIVNYKCSGAYISVMDALWLMKILTFPKMDIHPVCYGGCYLLQCTYCAWVQ